MASSSTSSSGFQNVPKIIHPPPSQHSHSSCLVIPPLAQTLIWRWPLALPPHWSTTSTHSPRPASASPVISTPVPITRTVLVHFLISLLLPMSSSLQISWPRAVRTNSDQVSANKTLPVTLQHQRSHTWTWHPESPNFPDQSWLYYLYCGQEQHLNIWPSARDTDRHWPFHFWFKGSSGGESLGEKQFSLDQYGVFQHLMIIWPPYSQTAFPILLTCLLHSSLFLLYWPLIAGSYSSQFSLNSHSIFLTYLWRDTAHSHHITGTSTRVLYPPLIIT